MKVTILYGSATGNAEHIAKDLGKSINESKVTSAFKSADVMEMNMFKRKKLMESWIVKPDDTDGMKKHALIIVTSTTGNGDAPENASRFVRYLKKPPPATLTSACTTPTKPLEHVAYSVLALGDTNYDQFCIVGCKIDKKLNAWGAKRGFELVCADEATGLEGSVEPWLDGVLGRLATACVEDIAVEEKKSEEKKEDDGELAVRLYNGSPSPTQRRIMSSNEPSERKLGSGVGVDNNSLNCATGNVTASGSNNDIGIDVIELDVFTLMFLANVRSPSFLFSVMIFCLQGSMLILTLTDLLRHSEEYNLMKIPINNPPEVVASQFMSLVALVLLQEHTTFVTLVRMTIPPSTIHFEDYPSATRSKWMLGNACRLLVHTLSMLVSFVFIVQINGVIDIFQDFAAIQFVTGLSHVAFFCAQYGTFGNIIKQDVCYAKAWKHTDNEESVNGLHALGKAQLAGEKFQKALGTYRKAMDIAAEDRKGECKQKLDEAQEHVALTRNKKRSRESLSAGIAFLVLGGMLAGWAYLVAQQETNKLLISSACQRIDVQLGSEVYDFSDQKVSSPFPLDLDMRPGIPVHLDLESPSPLHYSYFNGIYSSNWDDISNDRPVYFENNSHTEISGKFSYCKEESVWVFKIGEFNDGIERGACGQWLLRSGPTEEFLLEMVSSEWTVWIGSAQSVSIDVKCLDCRKSTDTRSGCNFNGECNSDNGTCTCKQFDDTDEDYFGELCQAPPPCKPVDVFVHGETADDYRQVAHFMPLETSNGKRVLTYQRPVYWNKRNMKAEKQNFLLYTGSRWYHTDWPLTDLCPDLPRNTCDKTNFANFFTLNFHAYWFDTLMSNTLYVSEETSSFTPVGLNWLTIEQQNRAQGDFGWLGYTFDEQVSAHCFKADCEKTGLCGNYGECINDSRYNLTIRSRCKCNNGTSGYFCQFSSYHPYVANQINASDPCNEFYCDYLYEQELGFGGGCSAQCKETKELKACWNKPGQCPDIDIINTEIF